MNILMDKMLTCGWVRISHGLTLHVASVFDEVLLTRSFRSQSRHYYYKYRKLRFGSGNNARDMVYGSVDRVSIQNANELNKK